MNNGPTRIVSKNFTAATLRRAKRAKRRQERRLQPILKTSFGVITAVFVVLIGGVTTYATTQNWFSGVVGVNQNGSIITLDLAGCELPPGVHDPNLRAVKFKVLGEDHVGQEGLQRAMAADCEFNAVSNFFLGLPVEANVWARTPATILAVDGDTMTFRYLNPNNYAQTVTRAIDVKGARAFANRNPALLSDLHVGDHTLLGLTATSHPQADADIFGERVENRHITILKTQFDLSQAPSASQKNIYEEWNIMPLDWYRQPHR